MPDTFHLILLAGSCSPAAIPHRCMCASGRLMLDPRIGAIRRRTRRITIKVGFWTPVRVEVERPHGDWKTHGSRSPCRQRRRADDRQRTTSQQQIGADTNRTAADLHEGRPRWQLRFEISLLDGDTAASMSNTLRPDREGETLQQPCCIAGDRRVDRVAWVRLRSDFGDAFPIVNRTAGESARQRRRIDKRCRLADRLVRLRCGRRARHFGWRTASCAASWRLMRRDIAALARWVELGGRLVVLCGGEMPAGVAGRRWTAGPLRAGKVGRSRSPSGDGAAGAFRRSRRRRSRCRRARCCACRGLSMLRAISKCMPDSEPTDLPLVVRSPRVGRSCVCRRRFQPTAAGRLVGSRRRFFRRCCGLTWRTVGSGDALADGLSRAATTIFAERFGSSLAGRLRRVVPIGFPVVAVLAIAYLHSSWPARLSVGQSLAAPAVGGVDYVSADRRRVLRCGACRWPHGEMAARCRA